MRDWLLLQFRRGVAADDQATLFAAEQRQRAAGGLRIGQVPTPFAAAFYSASRPAFFPRVTRPLTSAAVVLHVGSGNVESSRAWCRAFNARAGKRRQLYIAGKGSQVRSLDGLKECKQELGMSRCPYAGGQKLAAEDAVFQPGLRPTRQLKIVWGEGNPRGQIR